MVLMTIANLYIWFSSLAILVSGIGIMSGLLSNCSGEACLGRLIILYFSLTFLFLVSFVMGISGFFIAKKMKKDIKKANEVENFELPSGINKLRRVVHIFSIIFLSIFVILFISYAFISNL